MANELDTYLQRMGLLPTILQVTGLNTDSRYSEFGTRNGISETAQTSVTTPNNLITPMDLGIYAPQSEYHQSSASSNISETWVGQSPLSHHEFTSRWQTGKYSPSGTVSSLFRQQAVSNAAGASSIGYTAGSKWTHEDHPTGYDCFSVNEQHQGVTVIPVNTKPSLENAKSTQMAQRKGAAEISQAQTVFHLDSNSLLEYSGPVVPRETDFPTLHQSLPTRTNIASILSSSTMPYKPLYDLERVSAEDYMILSGSVSSESSESPNTSNIDMEDVAQIQEHVQNLQKGQLLRADTEPLPEVSLDATLLMHSVQPSLNSVVQICNSPAASAGTHHDFRHPQDYPSSPESKNAIDFRANNGHYIPKSQSSRSASTGEVSPAVKSSLKKASQSGLRKNVTFSNADLVHVEEYTICPTIPEDDVFLPFCFPFDDIKQNNENSFIEDLDIRAQSPQNSENLQEFWFDSSTDVEQHLTDKNSSTNDSPYSAPFTIANDVFGRTTIFVTSGNFRPGDSGKLNGMPVSNLSDHRRTLSTGTLNGIRSLRTLVKVDYAQGFLDINHNPGQTAEVESKAVLDGSGTKSSYKCNGDVFKELSMPFGIKEYPKEQITAMKVNRKLCHKLSLYKRPLIITIIVVFIILFCLAVGLAVGLEVKS